MSISNCVYLGPYLECEYTTVEEQRLHKECGNEDCYKRGQRITPPAAIYCFACGRPLADVSETVEVPGVNE